MEKVIPDEMKAALRRSRPEINSMYEYFRTQRREPDSEDILEIFRRALLPLYEKGIIPHDDIVCGLFGEVLNLSGRGFIGRHGRYRSVESCLFRVLDCHPALLASCAGFMTSVFNALYNLKAAGESRAEEWTDAMCSGWRTEDAASFRKLGFVLAWRHGLARYRETAINIAAKLTDGLLDRVFGPGGREMLRALEDDPWGGSGECPLFLRTGGHRAFGGRFAGIPGVFSAGGVLYARDGDEVCRIYADCFGVETVQDDEPVQAGAAESEGRDVKFMNGKFIHAEGEFSLPEDCCGDVMSSAAAGNTVAWTMRNSYKIYIAGLKHNA